MQTLAGTVRDQEEKRTTEQRCFVEEQNIRRSLGPALWIELCDEIEKECSNVNRASVGLVKADRTPEEMRVRHLKTGRVFTLEYNGMAPCIVFRHYPGPIQNIMFQVVSGPTPSLMLALDGVPKPMGEMVMDFMIRLING